MLRSLFASFLCRLAGHPQEPLECGYHYSGLMLSTVCPCGAIRFDR